MIEKPWYKDPTHGAWVAITGGIAVAALAFLIGVIWSALGAWQNVQTL